MRAGTENKHETSEYFDGSKTYKVTLPKDIPAGKFWSLTLYDNQTRSMLDTPQRYPRAGSRSSPTPAADPSADGSTTLYFGPTKPEGASGRKILVLHMPRPDISSRHPKARTVAGGIFDCRVGGKLV